MGKPPHLVPSHLDVEQDVGSVADFIRSTNSVVMESQGVATLGRTAPEAYHRLSTFTSVVRSNVLVVQLVAAARPANVHALAPEAVEWTCRDTESVLYPARDVTRRREGG